MYRLGASYTDSSVPRDTDIDLRNSFLSPTTPIVRRPSGSDDVIGGSIYDPSYYSSLFEDNRDVGLLIEVKSFHSIFSIALLDSLCHTIMFSCNQNAQSQHYLK